MTRKRVPVAAGRAASDNTPRPAHEEAVSTVSAVITQQEDYQTPFFSLVRPIAPIDPELLVRLYNDSADECVRRGVRECLRSAVKGTGAHALVAQNFIVSDEGDLIYSQPLHDEVAYRCKIDKRVQDLRKCWRPQGILES